MRLGVLLSSVLLPTLAGSTLATAARQLHAALQALQLSLAFLDDTVGR